MYLTNCSLFVNGWPAIQYLRKVIPFISWPKETETDDKCTFVLRSRDRWIGYKISPQHRDINPLSTRAFSWTFEQQTPSSITSFSSPFWLHLCFSLLSFFNIRLYSVYVLDNRNLQDLFVTPHQNFSITRGKVFFHFNPKLCYHKIQEFAATGGLSANLSTGDVSRNTNGDFVACKFQRSHCREKENYVN